MAKEHATSAQVPVEDMFRHLKGMAYCHWWTFKSRFEYLLQKYAAGFLALSLILLLLELLLEVFHRDFGEAAVYLKAGFAVAFTITAVDKYRDWTKQRDEYLFLGAIHAVSGALTEPAAHADKTLQVILELCRDSFKDRKAEVTVTLALREPQGGLAILHRVPDPGDRRRGERPTRFNNYEGGVGYAYGNRAPVYIPSTSMGQGIVWALRASDPFAVESKMYVRHSREKRPYKSILSLPVVISDQCFGTLSIDSTRRNAFKKSDFLKAMHFATSVAQVLHNSSPSGALPALPAPPVLPKKKRSLTGK